MNVYPRPALLRRITPHAIVVLGVLLVTLGFSARARADIAQNDLRRIDQRGAIVHAVPVSNHQVRMAAERVVLVPYFDAKHNEPRLLTHVWYDMVNEGPRARLQLGFPELRSFVHLSLGATKRPWTAYEKSLRSWTLPTISAFGARRGRRHYAVRSHPGVGPYRRWFGFGMTLAPRKTVRLHTTYLSSLAQTQWGRWNDGDPKQGITTRYFLHYILHTGALWRGPIGVGEVHLYHAGDLHLVRRFARLEPTAKDDIHVELGFRVVDWEAEGGQGHRQRGRTPDLRHRLPHASGTLESSRVDTHVGLVVDGDPETHWVSPRGAALRSYVQLPSSPARRLTEVRITSGRPPRGAARPSRVVLRCLSRTQKHILARVSLPDTAGPHPVRLKRPARCAAIRAQVTAVHGSATASVAIAELKQRFARKARWKPKPTKGPRQPTAGVKAGARRDDALAFDRAGVDHVMWSQDGALLHYRLHLENVRPPFGGVRLGYFVDVATGKVVRVYRLDRSGKLPLTYARDWRRAAPFEQGEALLRKREFRPALGPRRKPGEATPGPRAVRLRGRIAPGAGILDIQATTRGYRWTFATSGPPSPPSVDATFELLHRPPRQKELLLARHSSRIDRAFAARHAKVWKARRPYFKRLVQVFRSQWMYDSQHMIDLLPAHLWKRMPQVWHHLTYPHPEAYGGEVRVFWEPRGCALAALWIDRKDHSAHRPVEKPSVFQKEPDGTLIYMADYDQYISRCARDLRVVICPWDRRGEPRHRVRVSVHTLSTRDPARAGPQPKQGPRQRTTPARAAPKPRPPQPVHAQRRGCGCASTPSGIASVPLPLLLCVGFAFLRRRPRRRRREATLVVAVAAAVVLLGGLGSALAAPKANAPAAKARPLRLRAYFDLPLPAGGRIYGPRALRRVLLMVHYPRERAALLKQLQKLLQANRWKVARQRLGETPRQWLNNDYLQLWLRKGPKEHQRVRLVLVRNNNNKDTVIFVTRGK